MNYGSFTFVRLKLKTQLTQNMSSAISLPIQTDLAELNGLKQKMDALNTKIETERKTVLRQLPADLGFANVDDFVTAVRIAHSEVPMTGAPAGRSNGSGKSHGKASTKSGGRKGANGRKPRASITLEKREEIKGWFKQHGNEQGAVLKAVKMFNIAPATAQIIKGEAGMVNTR